ncbi:MAG TPA: hypothetical protein VFC50_00690 [Candidatus Dormibacteraeota bacterium]|nr:hypothetical protein [Candidatus Dormibacteraeota bacterium]
MSRPAVEIGNYPAAYDFYADYQPSMAAARVGHALMGGLYRVNLDFAEGARSEIANLRDEGVHFIISSNHITDRDQFTLGAFPTEDEVLKFLIGHTVIPAKETIYTATASLPVVGPLVGPLVRRGADIMGAVPAFRVKDQFGDTPREDRDPESAALQKASSAALLSTMVARVNRGHEATFEEGQRNLVYPREVQDPKRGHVDLMNHPDLDPSITVATVPIGIYYPELIKGGKLRFRHGHPSVYMGRPITERIDTLEKLAVILKPKMQENADVAIEMVRERDGEDALLPEEELREVMAKMAEVRERKKLEREEARAA